MVPLPGGPGSCLGASTSASVPRPLTVARIAPLARPTAWRMGERNRAQAGFPLRSARWLGPSEVEAEEIGQDGLVGLGPPGGGVAARPGQRASGGGHASIDRPLIAEVLAVDDVNCGGAAVLVVHLVARDSASVFRARGA